MPKHVPFEIVMYSMDGCEYCDKARRYLDGHKLPYTEIKINEFIQRKRFYEKHELPNGKMPQIFVDGVRFGGSNSLEFHNVAKLYRDVRG